MELEARWVRERLDGVLVSGWDGDDGRDLLDAVRLAVVVPLVRRRRWVGAAARQAEATGWATAWEVLRRPTARTCENPAGMVWVAVRRAIAEEAIVASTLTFALPLDGDHGPAAMHLTYQDEHACLVGQDELGPLAGLGRSLGPIAAALVRQGWAPGLLGEAITLLADNAFHRQGRTGARWRWLSLQLGLPEWQARRLAGLIVGAPGSRGLLELVIMHGRVVLADPDAVAAMRATLRQGASPPWHHLAVIEARWLAPSGRRARSGSDGVLAAHSTMLGNPGDRAPLSGREARTGTHPRSDHSDEWADRDAWAPRGVGALRESA